MRSGERGFALMAVLVILSAVSLLGMAALERASLSLSLGKAVQSSYLRDVRMRDAVVAMVESGLSVGYVGACVDGSCGRSTSGVPRVWTAASIAANGVTSGACSSVSEYLGLEGGVNFWRVAATCDGAMVVADVSVAASGVAALEWGGP